MTKRFDAFTLAEVLITLGIIGVVAAMTMPTLMNQTNGAQYKAAYKKALSAISQGVTLNVALDGGSFADAEQGTPGKTDKPTTGGDSVASILASRMNVVKATGYDDIGYTIQGTIPTIEHACTEPEVAASTGTAECEGKGVGTKVNLPSFTPDTALFFNDGSMFAFDSQTAPCSKDGNVTGANICGGIIDVNGAKGPNKIVTCDAGTGVAADKTAGTSAIACEAKNPTDVYVVEFYDQTILPATDAAKAVLYGK